MTSRLAVISIALCVACGGQGDRDAAQAYVAKEVVKLRGAVAAHDPSNVAFGCMSVTTGLSRLPPAMTSEIEQLCYDDAPRVLLEASVAEAKKDQASSLDQLGHELTCYQLYAEQAFKWRAKRRTPSPALDALAAEYEHLCPERVASYRAAATSSGSRSTPRRDRRGPAA